MDWSEPLLNDSCGALKTFPPSVNLGKGDMTDALDRKPEDAVFVAMKASLSLIPTFGGSLAEFYSFVVGDPAAERRDDFLRDLFD